MERFAMTVRCFPHLMKKQKESLLFKASGQSSQYGGYSIQWLDRRDTELCHKWICGSLCGKALNGQSGRRLNAESRSDRLSGLLPSNSFGDVRRVGVIYRYLFPAAWEGTGRSKQIGKIGSHSLSLHRSTDMKTRHRLDSAPSPCRPPRVAYRGFSAPLQAIPQLDIRPSFIRPFGSLLTWIPSFTTINTKAILRGMVSSSIHCEKLYEWSGRRHSAQAKFMTCSKK